MFSKKKSLKQTSSCASRIESSMRSLRLWPLVLIFCLPLPLLYAQAPGSFRGTVIESNDGSSRPGWIFVQGRNGVLRRVEIAHARVQYDQSVPPADRHRQAQAALVAGTEVRITAAQDNTGEWRATRVEILSLGAGSGHGGQSSAKSRAS